MLLIYALLCAYLTLPDGIEALPDTETPVNHVAHHVTTKQATAYDVNLDNGIESGGIGNEYPLKEQSFKRQLPECKFSAVPRTVVFFDSKLETVAPNFVQFGVIFNNSLRFTQTEDVFLPKHWFWTYSSPFEKYPYLSWNIDFGVLSFGLLDAKSIEIKYVLLLEENHPCTGQFGSLNTTKNIVSALGSLVNMTRNGYRVYDNSAFCFLTIDLSLRETVEYQLSLYIGLPITYINYRCCKVYYDYVAEEDKTNCTEKPVEKWSQTLIVPFILGVLAFFYSPILVFHLSAWLAKGEHISDSNYSELSEDFSNQGASDEGNWIYLDGHSPMTVIDIFQFLCCSISDKCPVFVSRIRRSFILLSGPLIIYIQLYMYKDGMGVGTHKIYVRDLVKVGTPMGFLAFLGDAPERGNSFVPLLGGPVGVLIMYHVFGFFCIVLPKSVKHIVESGLLRSNSIHTTQADSLAKHPLPNSPFCLPIDEVIQMSSADIPSEKGYRKAAAYLKYSVYMLLTRQYWTTVLAIQKERLSITSVQTRTVVCIKVFCLPFMFVFGLVETVLSVIFYLFPFFNFTVIMIRGFIRERLLKRRLRENHCLTVIQSNPVVIFVGVVILLLGFVLFTYAYCLIFVHSFFFVAQVISFCFVAVIVYPSVSFGYLFFFVVLLYYLVRLVRDFGDGYLELLSIAVERSLDIDNRVNYVTVFDGSLVISNVRVQTFHRIMINECPLTIPKNTVQAIQQNAIQTSRTRLRGNVYGIPKELYTCLVHRYKPLHIRFFKVVLHMALIIVLIMIVMTITSKFTSSLSSEISDVMHVIFLVTVGALPRVMEIAMTNEGKVINKETESRNIEESIMEYWERQRCNSDRVTSAYCANANPSS